MLKIMLAKSDLKDIENMFEQYSRSIMFPEKEDEWDGQIPTYIEELEIDDD